MPARLTFADYHSPGGWKMFDLSEEFSSHRTFWACVLQVAAWDGATCVLFQVDQGEDCL